MLVRGPHRRPNVRGCLKWYPPRCKCGCRRCTHCRQFKGDSPFLAKHDENCVDIMILIWHLICVDMILILTLDCEAANFCAMNVLQGISDKAAKKWLKRLWHSLCKSNKTMWQSRVSAMTTSPVCDLKWVSMINTLSMKYAQKNMWSKNGQHLKCCQLEKTINKTMKK